MTRYRRASGFPIACALPPPYQHRPLHRREGLQQHQERHGQRAGRRPAGPGPPAGTTTGSGSQSPTYVSRRTRADLR
jgi:hypothetical protein